MGELYLCTTPLGNLETLLYVPWDIGKWTTIAAEDPSWKPFIIRFLPTNSLDP